MLEKRGDWLPSRDGMQGAKLELRPTLETSVRDKRGDIRAGRASGGSAASRDDSVGCTSERIQKWFREQPQSNLRAAMPTAMRISRFVKYGEE